MECLGVCLALDGLEVELFRAYVAVKLHAMKAIAGERVLRKILREI